MTTKPPPGHTSTAEDALVRVVRARATALQHVSGAREMAAALRLLQREVPVPARAAIHEIKKAAHALLGELDR